MTGPDDHAGFYRRTLGAAAGEGLTDVLISGSADELMLHHVVEAYRAAGHQPNVTIVDLCESPLIRCQNYAAPLGIELQTVRRDLNHWRPDRRFDLIVTDSFLTRFAPLERLPVLESWRRLLRPGGRVVTTAGFNDATPNGNSVGMSTREAARFVKHAVEAATTLHRSAPVTNGVVSPEVVAVLASTYSRLLRTHPFPNGASVVEAFAGAGFTVDTCESSIARREMVFVGMMRIVARR